MNVETPEHRLKRMQMRANRRGTKEMDLVLGPFAKAHLARMDAPGLDLFDALLSENDQDLYQWVTGQVKCTPQYTDLIDEIAVHAGLT